MASNSNDIVVLSGLFITDTEKATYMKIDEEEVWIPKSQFKRESILAEEDNNMWTIFIPRWLADKNDLDYVELDDWEDTQEEE